MTKHSDLPPQLPEITDEASDTPAWVPRLGVALFIVFVLGIVWRHGHAGGADTSEAVATDRPTDDGR